MDKTHLTADALCDFAEGLMPPADRREAEAHLAACAECRREVAAMQGYFAEMSGLGTLKAPDRFLTKVHARIAKASPWRRLLAALSSPRLLPAPLAGLAVILIGVYFAYLSPRLADQALPEPQAAPAAPAPERTVKLAKKQEQPAAESDEAAKPAPEPEQRIAALSKAERSNRVAVRKSAPARPKADDGYAESAPAGPKADIGSTARLAETEALAQAEPSVPAQGRREGKAEAKGGGAAAGNKENQLKDQEVVGWLDNPSAVYIMGGGESSDAVLDQIAGSPGVADRVKDAPSPAPKTPAAKANEPLAVARPSSREDLRDLDADEEAGYSDERAFPRKRSAPAAAAPPAATPKPWPPQVFTLKSRSADPDLRKGLAKLGVKVLRQEDRRYELEVPDTKLIDLETWLGGLGALTTSSRPRERPINGLEPHSDPLKPGKPAGSPIRLTLQVVSP